MSWFWIIFAVLFCVIFYFSFKAFYQDAKIDENNKKRSRYQSMTLVFWIAFAILVGIFALAKWTDFIPS